MFNIRTAFLSEEDSEALSSRYPHLSSAGGAVGPDQYCPTCEKKNVNADGRSMYKWKGEWHVCDCELQLQLYKHYLLAGVGVTYQRLDWVDFQGDSDAIKLARVYLSKPDFVERGIGLLFFGEFGVGKTMLANLVLKDLIKRGKSCYGTTFAGMIDMFTAGWRSDAQRAEFGRRILDSDVLLLDDLGRELKRSTKLSESTFDDVLRTRVQEGRVTLITTNLHERELTEGYGAAILSLLKERSMGHGFKGSDFRGKANDRLLQEIMDGETRPLV